MQVYTIQYTYAPASADRRAELLEQHRTWLTGIEEDSRLLGAGVYADGDGALLIIVSQDEAAVSAELARDPFVDAGLITNADVRLWTPTWGPVGEIVAKTR